MFSSICSGTIYGLQSCLIQVEVDVSRGLPCFLMGGNLSSEVKESAERVRIALRNTQMELPVMHVSVNFSPADLHKSGTGFDLPIALGVLCATGKLPADALDETFVIGELGLNGELKPVRGILPLCCEAEQNGKKNILLPVQNLAEAASVEGLRVAGFQNLADVIRFLSDTPANRIAIQKQMRLKLKKKSAAYPEEKLDFSDIKGQETLKRGAVIAAAGFHHMLLMGPPGAGKTMIARRIPTILPLLDQKESMEVSSIYSIAGRLPQNGELMKRRPFVNPHHTITTSAMAGGGRIPQPGEMSLAHRGVLFLDEMPEFKRQIIDLLRQPLEEKKIRLTRNAGTFIYPAHMMLVGAMNPCPCGYYPDRNRCRCTPYEIHTYLSHISGPILDRMDLCLEASRVQIKDIHSREKGMTSLQMKEAVDCARNRQEARYRHTKLSFNSELQAADMELYCPLGEEQQKLAEKIYRKMQLSVRGYHRLLKVARTIADIEESEQIQSSHLLEAVCYRTVVWE